MEKDTHISETLTNQQAESHTDSGIVLHAQPLTIFLHRGSSFTALRNTGKNPLVYATITALRWRNLKSSFIDGDDIDCDLFKALGVHQGNFDTYLSACADWDETQKIKVIIAVGECGYRFDPATSDPDDLDVDLYEMNSLRDLADQFVDEGLFGDIPERIQCYLDFDAIAP